MKLYISGPMRGRPGYNYGTFNEVEECLYRWRGSIAGTDDFTVINPAKNFDGDTSLDIATYMTRDLQQVLEADGIVLLPGWRDSEGAKLEVRVALVTGKKFYEAAAHAYSPTGDPLTDPASPQVEWTFTEVNGPLEHEPDGNAGSPRAAVLADASRIITTDRNNQYGEPTQDFRRSSEAMTALGYRHTRLGVHDPDCPTCGARALQPHDTAVTVSMVKYSRIMWDATNRDSWVDATGYGACGWECIETTKAR